jgi:cation diffusion facilitator CzcD-associated flavoprotein CzcO
MRYEPMGMELPLETFVDYALWLQANLVGDIQALDVVNLRRVDGHFQLTLSDGRSLVARKVVIALELKGFAQTPAALQGLPERYASHSARYGDLEWAQGKDVVIVGGGQSALGLAALLHEQGSRVHVLMREAGVLWHPRPQAQRLHAGSAAPLRDRQYGDRAQSVRCAGCVHSIDHSRKEALQPCVRWKNCAGKGSSAVHRHASFDP